MTLICAECRQYVPMREMQEGPDGLWRCIVHEEKKR